MCKRETKNQPIRLPGLKPGVRSGLILSGAFYPDLKIGVWRRRTYQDCAIYIKTIFFCQYFIEILFLGKLFRPFQESNDKTCKHGSKRIPPKSPSKRPSETHQMATVDWTCHGSHPVKKSCTESYVAFCEFALWRSLELWLGWQQIRFRIKA